MATEEYQQRDAREQRFVRYLDHLRRELQFADFHFRLSKRLMICVNSYNAELNNAPAFWGATINAHREAALWHLFRVIDQHPDGLHITKFLNYVENNWSFFPEVFSRSDSSSWVSGKPTVSHQTIDDDRKRLDELRSTIDTMKTWRDKAYAHSDPRFVFADVDVHDKHPLPIDDFENVIRVVWDMLDTYGCAYNDTTWDMYLPGEAGIQTVMDALRLASQEGTLLRERRLRDLRIERGEAQAS